MSNRRAARLSVARHTRKTPCFIRKIPLTHKAFRNPPAWQKPPPGCELFCCTKYVQIYAPNLSKLALFAKSTPPTQPNTR
ncbi:hypothetical protein ARMA_0748 [Ardenticatena maritima]|uniref:Uncharacterized protein n=1 Tax=Ardenticatena maritima TaxID=872965 RepID=A0A0M8K5T6_9CHLR|nr:hypothetical protein ARMA_0748 [Ardenticatena maritima]